MFRALPTSRASRLPSGGRSSSHCASLTRNPGFVNGARGKNAMRQAKLQGCIAVTDAVRGKCPESKEQYSEARKLLGH